MASDAGDKAFHKQITHLLLVSKAGVQMLVEVAFRLYKQR